MKALATSAPVTFFRLESLTSSRAFLLTFLIVASKCSTTVIIASLATKSAPASFISSLTGARANLVLLAALFGAAFFFFAKYLTSYRYPQICKIKILYNLCTKHLTSLRLYKSFSPLMLKSVSLLGDIELIRAHDSLMICIRLIS